MTQIKFDFGHPSADGIADLAGEKIHVVPTGRFRNGSRRGLTHGGADAAA
ncbi:hypothetical protein [Bifidobacterium merycicum]|nr:hypothetical protein [Bifidobacterium merycicum]